MAQRVGDKGLGHSPVHGFSADGYPIYGPFHSNGVRSKSCWQKRDYNSQSPTGCPFGTRTCVLKNPLDYKEGKVDVYSGPSFTSTVNSLSGNPITCSTGVYKQDYFFNST